MTIVMARPSALSNVICLVSPIDRPRQNEPTDQRSELRHPARTFKLGLDRGRAFLARTRLENSRSLITQVSLTI